MIYKYKTEKRSSKDFSNYQNPIKLFKGLRDGNANPKEVLKNQINFKSDLGEIKKENVDLKSKGQVTVIQNVDNFFDLKDFDFDFDFDFFRDNSFLLS